jgi:GntR family transcriptional regulator, transcriptional repressor for pyruvate dehydrogenase complex
MSHIGRQCQYQEIKVGAHSTLACNRCYDSLRMLGSKVSTPSRLNENATARLITQIGELIESGALRPGERLPSERDLAKQFASSRTSLRSAMKVLETVGVISQRVGDGSYLNKDASRVMHLPLTFLVLLDGISLIDLFEARLMIEPEVAARAAEAASAEDLAAMRNSLNAMATDIVNADIAFHGAVCKATRNVTCYRMFGAIHQAFRKGMEVTSRLAPVGLTFGFHKAIYSAIHLRQPDEARRRMAEHLNDAKDRLLKACLEEGFPGSVANRDT